jgi:chromosome segregation ATPase
VSTREAYVDKIKARLDAWNADIDRLQARAREAEADARLKYDEQIKEMKAQRDAAEAKLREARSASEVAWRDMRGGFEKAWEDMSGAFENAMKRFR